MQERTVGADRQERDVEVDPDGLTSVIFGLN